VPRTEPDSSAAKQIGSRALRSVLLNRRTFLSRTASAGFSLVAAGSKLPSIERVPRYAAVPRSRHFGPPMPRKLADAIRGPVIERGSASFRDAARIYNQRFDHVSPAAVARPLDPADAAAAVRWAATYNVPLRARSGGHSYAGYSTLSDGVVLDLRNLRQINFDRRAGTATIGAGAQLIDVYAALARKKATIPAGSCPSVGIGGHAVGGGIGLVGRAFGMTADNLLAAQLVTADGQIRLIDKQSDPDLLWALRGGGGGNFGVITDLVFRLRHVPSSASWFVVSWPWAVASDALAAWQAWAPHARDELTSVFHLQTGASEPVVAVAGQYLGTTSRLGRLLAPLNEVAGASISIGDQDYFGLQLRWAGCLGQPLRGCHTVGTRPRGTLDRALFRAKSDYVTKPLSGAARALLVSAVEREQGSPGLAAILLDAYGGAINRVPPDATAFVHRNALYCIQYLAYGRGAGWLVSTYARMRPHVSGMACQNYMDADLRMWRKAYYGARYLGLVAIQGRVDPEVRFDYRQEIGS